MIHLSNGPIEVLLPSEHEAFMQAAIGYNTNDFKYELGGVGRITIQSDGSLLLGEPIILKQEVTQGDCEFHTAIVEWLKTWTPESCEQAMPNINYYTWHSHNSMKTFRSGQDDTWIKNYVNSGMLVTLIGNHKGDWKVWVDTVTEKANIHYHQQLKCELDIICPNHKEIVARALAARDKYVTVHKTVVVKSSGSWKGGVWQRNDRGDYPLLSSGSYTTPSLARDAMNSHGNAEYPSYMDDFDNFDDPTELDVPPKVTARDEHGDVMRLNIALLVKKHGASMRVYFVLGETPTISFMCNAMTMYTINIPAGSKSRDAFKRAFRMSNKALGLMIGRGVCIRYVPTNKKGPRWELIRKEVN